MANKDRINIIPVPNDETKTISFTTKVDGKEIGKFDDISAATNAAKDYVREQDEIAKQKKKEKKNLFSYGNIAKQNEQKRWEYETSKNAPKENAFSVENKSEEKPLIIPSAPLTTDMSVENKPVENKIEVKSVDKSEVKTEEKPVETAVKQVENKQVENKEEKPLTENKSEDKTVEDKSEAQGVWKPGEVEAVLYNADWVDDHKTPFYERQVHKTKQKNNDEIAKARFSGSPEHREELFAKSRKDAKNAADTIYKYYKNKDKGYIADDKEPIWAEDEELTFSSENGDTIKYNFYSGKVEVLRYGNDEWEVPSDEEKLAATKLFQKYLDEQKKTYEEEANNAKPNKKEYADIYRARVQTEDKLGKLQTKYMLAETPEEKKAILEEARNVKDNYNEVSKRLITREVAEELTSDTITKLELTNKYLKDLNAKLKKEKLERKNGFYDDGFELQFGESSNTDEKLSNYLYGHSFGENLKDEEVAQKEKRENFEKLMKNNPTVANAIFSEKSGLTMKDRALLLGNVLANIGGNVLGAFGAGLNKRAYNYKPSAVEDYFNRAYENAFNRKQEEYNAEQEAKTNRAKYRAFIDNSIDLQSLPEDVKDYLADSLISGNVDWNKVSAMSENEIDISNTQEAFERARVNAKSLTDQMGNALDVESKKLEVTGKLWDTVSKEIKTRKEANDVVTDLISLRNTLYNKLLDLQDTTQDQYIKNLSGLSAYLKGIHSETFTSGQQENENAVSSASEGKTKTNSISGDVSGSIGAKTFLNPINIVANMNAALRGSSTTAKQNQKQATNSNGETYTTGNSQTFDQLLFERIPNIESVAENWKKQREVYIREYNKIIYEQIDEVNQMIENAKQQRDSLPKSAKINDGIVKAPRMKQWLVREDGSKIELHPDDTIYATKKTIVNSADINNKDDVIPMKVEDKAIIIKQKLGNKKLKSKKPQYYFDLLK